METFFCIHQNTAKNIYQWNAMKDFAKFKFLDSRWEQSENCCEFCFRYPKVYSDDLLRVSLRCYTMLIVSCVMVLAYRSFVQ